MGFQPIRQSLILDHFLYLFDTIWKS